MTKCERADAERQGQAQPRAAEGVLRTGRAQSERCVRESAA